MIQWIFLLLAGIFEVFWAISLKWTDGFTNVLFLLLNVVIGLVGSFCLAQAMKNIPVLIAYPIWKGSAIIGLLLWEVIAQRNQFHPVRTLFVLLILLGIIGLKFYDPNSRGLT